MPSFIVVKINIRADIWEMRSTLNLGNTANHNDTLPIFPLSPDNLQKCLNQDEFRQYPVDFCRLTILEPLNNFLAISELKKYLSRISFQKHSINKTTQDHPRRKSN